MFVTKTMKHLTGSVFIEDIDKVTAVLLNSGVVEPVAIADLEGSDQKGLTLHYNTETKERIDVLLTQYQKLFTLGKLVIPDIAAVQHIAAVHPIISITLEECEQYITEINKFIEKPMADRHNLEKDIQQKILLLSALQKHQDSEGGTFTKNPEKEKEYQEKKILQIRAGKINFDKFTLFQMELKKNPEIWIDQMKENDAILVKLTYLDNAKNDINHTLHQFGWMEISLNDIPAISNQETVAILEKNLEMLKENLQELQAQIVSGIIQYKLKLEQGWIGVYLRKLYARFETGFACTSQVCFFSGWIPAQHIKKVSKALIKETSGHIICEIKNVKKVNNTQGKRIMPPTSLSNPKILKPFEGLVKTYSVPAYNTLDPTFFVATLFVSMFGFMFADVGHGLVISLSGIAILCRIKSKKDMGLLMIYCGLSAIVCGIIFGSYFGYQLTVPLWFDYEGIANNQPSHHILKTSILTIDDVFRISIFFGIFVIYLSFLFNWINRIKRGEFIELLLERNGILGGWMYWVGIQLVWNYVSTNYTSFGDLSSLPVNLTIPCALLFFSEPAKYLFRKEEREKHMMSFKLIGSWIGDWIINLFEYGVNSLSNTISFIRIAGLGMAHIILMSTFYTMADNYGIFLRILIIILANVIVIALEGLSAGINSVRLNYYEFFTRYFIGNGRTYKPITIRD